MDTESGDRDQPIRRGRGFLQRRILLWSRELHASVRSFGFSSVGVQVLNGVPFNLRGGVVATIEGSNITGQANLVSVEWLGIEVLDESGMPTTDFSLTSASGIDWTLASVPEPNTAPSLTPLAIALLATLLGLAGWWRLRA